MPLRQTRTQGRPAARLANGHKAQHREPDDQHQRLDEVGQGDGPETADHRVNDDDCRADHHAV